MAIKTIFKLHYFAMVKYVFWFSNESINPFQILWAIACAKLNFKTTRVKNGNLFEKKTNQKFPHFFFSFELNRWINSYNEIIKTFTKINLQLFNEVLKKKIWHLKFFVTNSALVIETADPKILLFVKSSSPLEATMSYILFCILWQ